MPPSWSPSTTSPWTSSPTPRAHARPASRWSRTNLSFDWEFGDRAAVEAAVAKAAHVTKLRLINNRLVANAIEPRAAIADFDAASGTITLHTCT
jgi:aerobic carbon-monoxide dehydrogenase large subunit